MERTQKSKKKKEELPKHAWIIKDHYCSIFHRSVPGAELVGRLAEEELVGDELLQVLALLVDVELQPVGGFPHEVAGASLRERLAADTALDAQ